MAKTTVVDCEMIHQLCVRREARAASRFLTDRPEARKDLRLSAAVLREMLAHGVPAVCLKSSLGRAGRQLATGRGLNPSVASPTTEPSVRAKVEWSAGP